MKHRTVIYFVLSFLLVITLIYKIISRNPSSNLNVSNADSIPDFCQVTHRIETLRLQQNSIQVNPARHIVEELLEIITSNQSICENENIGERLAVTIVSTGRSHFMERQLIRRTWGSMDKYKDWRCVTVFLVGQSDYCLNVKGAYKENEDRVSKEEKTLMEEHWQFGDIVIGAFADTYRNLTYKHLMGFKFVQENCPEADFIIKTDDDMFVDIPAILDMRAIELKAIKREESRGRSSEKLFDIYCHLFHDSPVRDPTQQWFSTREEWPEDTYPAYCLGNGYAISMEWLKKIYSVRGLGGFFWVDDVFIMGKLREIAENTYNETTKGLNMRAAGMVTDKRSDPLYVRRECQRKESVFGWFVFLTRSNPDFVMNMECLWARALRIANLPPQY